jgi:hypothetical protein
MQCGVPTASAVAGFLSWALSEWASAVRTFPDSLIAARGLHSRTWCPNPAFWLSTADHATLVILYFGMQMLTSDPAVLIIPIVGTATPNMANGAKERPVGIAMTFLFFLFAFFYKPSWGATTWIWTTEIFSVNVRAQAVGMCSQMQNVANTIFQQFFPTFLANEQLKCFYFFMAVNFCRKWPARFSCPLRVAPDLLQGRSLHAQQPHYKRR